jgi:hypothetical protein
MWASSSSELSVFVSGLIAANQAEKMFRQEHDGGAGFCASSAGSEAALHEKTRLSKAKTPRVRQRQIIAIPPFT